jgi:hypothetical protein
VASAVDARDDIRVIARANSAARSDEPANASTAEVEATSLCFSASNDFRRKTVIELSQHAYWATL